MKKITILIVDDHKVIREGISSMLYLFSNTYTFLIDFSETGEDSIDKIKKNEYDLVIMDYQLPGINGAEATKKIIRKKPKTNILALSNYDEYMNIMSMINAGAKGFILKNIDADELLLAIETVLSGKNYYSNDVAAKLINFKPKKKLLKKTEPEAITSRERQILNLIIKEYTSQEIGDKLGISRRTVDKHREKIIEKLQVSKTAGLIKKAIELNLID